VRREHNTNFGHELGAPVTPRVGLSYVRDLGPATIKARVAYGEAIRPPGVGMKETSVTQIVTQAGNPDLAPERQTGWDGGFDVHFGTLASIGVTHYRQRAKDLIQQVWIDDIDDVPTYQYQNIALVNNTGWELEGTLDLGALRVNGQYAITRSRVGELGSWYTGSLVTGQQVTGVPKATGGLSADLTLRTGTTITSGLAYVGSRRAWDQLGRYRCLGGTGPCRTSINDFFMDQPGFTKVNLGIAQSVWNGAVGFVRVENLTGAIPGEITNMYPDAGRMVFTGIRITR
jgi:outer membrane receptor protein involved in Fe transport